MTDNNKEMLSKVLDRLDEVIVWLRLQGLPRIRGLLVTEMNTDAKRIAYQMTDGEHSRREVANLAGVSDDSVQNWWERWYQMGLLTGSERYKGRPRRVISLEELGIRSPRPKKGVSTEILPSEENESEEGRI